VDAKEAVDPVQIGAEQMPAIDEMYRGVVENIAIGVTLISPKMEILTLNSQMRNWFKHVDFSNHPICYRVFNDPPREEICSYCPTCKTLQDGEVHESLTETPTKNGTVNFRVISSPIRDIEGKVIAAIEMVEDVTERRRIEESLRESEEKFRALTDAALDAIILTDEKGNIASWNAAATRIFGYDESEVLGKAAKPLLVPDWKEEFARRYIEMVFP